MDRSLQKWSYTFSTVIWVFIVTNIISQNLVAGPAAAFSPENAGFALKFNSEVSPYQVISVFVLPGETVTLEDVFIELTGKEWEEDQQ